MIEEIKNTIAGIDAHIHKADEESLLPILLSLEIPEDPVEETNLELIERIAGMLDEALLAASSMATHYRNAFGHRKTADEAIAACEIPIESEIGQKVLGAVIRGAGTMNAIPGDNVALSGPLGSLKGRLITYEQLEKAKGHHEDKAREAVDFCSEALQIATETSTRIKKAL